MAVTLGNLVVVAARQAVGDYREAGNPVGDHCLH